MSELLCPKLDIDTVSINWLLTGGRHLIRGGVWFIIPSSQLIRHPHTCVVCTRLHYYHTEITDNICTTVCHHDWGSWPHHYCGGPLAGGRASVRLLCEMGERYLAWRRSRPRAGRSSVVHTSIFTSPASESVDSWPISAGASIVWVCSNLNLLRARTELDLGPQHHDSQYLWKEKCIH